MATSRVIVEPVVHRHELLAALSRGIDLCMGQPMGHLLGQTYVALLLADRAGLDPDARREVFYTSMLSWAGCHVDSYEQARWFGDDHRIKADIRMVDFVDDRASVAFVAHHIGAGRPWPERQRTIAAFRIDGQREVDAMFGNHRAAALALAEALGIPDGMYTGCGQVFERWDGKGEPDGLRGAEATFSARAANIGDVAMAIHRAGGTDAATAVARARSGTALDPDLVNLFCDEAEAVFGRLEQGDVFTATMDLCPPLDDALVGDGLEDALVTIADFVDLKSPAGLGHQSATAGLVDAASDAFGLPSPSRTMARHAALLHDLGRLGVPSAVWDSTHALTPAQVELIRLHPYLTEAMLDPSAAMRPLARIAGQHHERLDGSGYPRGVSGDAITLEGRLLAAADVYATKAEGRPHRAATPLADLPALMRREVQEGRVDAAAAEAVLVAAGHRRRKRREWPDGLTEREVDVLRLLARGETNAAIADALHISPKTVGSHLDHIYAKTGVHNRARAAVFAMRHALMTEGRARESATEDGAFA